MDENPEPAPGPEATPQPISESTSEPASESTVEIGSVNYGTLAYPYDGTIFSGDGTYYGETSGCLQATLWLLLGVANAFSLACKTVRTATVQAYVMDKCPECSSGDLDFSKRAEMAAGIFLGNS